MRRAHRPGRLPGDYLRVDLPGDPLVVTRDEDGELHALSRVCRHRFMDVLPPESAPERGSLKRLTCPYHTWTYKLDGEYAGQLHGAPSGGPTARPDS
ncbi:Rieske 2Fe-2S domain-containing protein [Streptomyces sp. PmtA]